MSNWTASALVIVAEPLVVGRRVLVLGQATSGVADRLVALGARSVHVFEPKPAGGPSSRQVSVAPLPPGDFDVRDGAFDLALIPDVDALPDAALWLARVRRVLGAEGALLVATASAGEDAYYRLYDAAALQFASVVMLAEVPFEGIAIAELGRADEPDVSVDTQLMETPRTPVAFIALASQTPLQLAPYTIVEAPPEADSSTQESDSMAPAELAEARLQADVQASQLEEERTARQRLEHDLHKLSDQLAAEKSARATAERAAESAPEAILLRERVAVLESSLQIAEESVELLSQRLVRAEESLQKKAEETLLLLAEIDAVHSRPPPSAPEVDDARVGELEEALAQLHEAHEKLQAEHLHLEEVHTHEVHVLEQQLRERAATVAQLERGARAKERAAKELVAHLEEASAPRGDVAASAVVAEHAAQVAALRKKLDVVAMDAARRQSDLEARGWRISELETRLQQLSSTPAEPGAVATELDALRQALSQEHAARVAAESGEALAQARRELEQKSALLHQLAVEREGQR